MYVTQCTPNTVMSSSSDNTISYPAACCLQTLIWTRCELTFELLFGFCTSHFRTAEDSARRRGGIFFRGRRSRRKLLRHVVTHHRRVVSHLRWVLNGRRGHHGVLVRVLVRMLVRMLVVKRRLLLLQMVLTLTRIAVVFGRVRVHLCGSRRWFRRLDRRGQSEAWLTEAWLTEAGVRLRAGEPC